MFIFPDREFSFNAGTILKIQRRFYRGCDLRMRFFFKCMKNISRFYSNLSHEFKNLRKTVVQVEI